jgi:hypothetical protein
MSAVSAAALALTRNRAREPLKNYLRCQRGVNRLKMLIYYV